MPEVVEVVDPTMRQNVQPVPAPTVSSHIAAIEDVNINLLPRRTYLFNSNVRPF